MKDQAYPDGMPSRHAAAGSQPLPRVVWDRHLGLALLVAAALVVPRSLLIAHAHSETWDEPYHLDNGLKFLTGSPLYDWNDPPLGQVLGATPLLLAGCRPTPGDSFMHVYSRVFYTQPISPETMQLLVALWKSLLFLPVVGLAFHWCRRLYGLWSAWLACLLLAVEPNLAAHIPLGAIDVLGMEGCVIACGLAWGYFQRPTLTRLAVAAAAMAMALLLKHTAVILPGVVMVYAFLWWVVAPWWQGQPWSLWRQLAGQRLAHLALAALLVPFAMWAFLFFDVHRPALVESDASLKGRYPAIVCNVVNALNERPLPAATYLESFCQAWHHGSEGNPAYLFGQKSMTGWWYYFPVVATYKVPLGVALLFLLALLSLSRVRPRWDEWSLVVPMIAWTAFMMRCPINMGFRHFLPAYVFLLLLATRCVASAGVGWRMAALAGVLATAFHAASYHPDYLCYLNFPRSQAYLDISDCNVDWGQSLKQVRNWIDQHPQPGRRVTLVFWGAPDIDFQYYLGDRIGSGNSYNSFEQDLTRCDNRPTTGLLIISPVVLAGTYDVWEGGRDPYAVLRKFKPLAVIGHSMLVYDLDQLGNGGPFLWPKPTKGAEGSSDGREP